MLEEPAPKPPVLVPPKAFEVVLLPKPPLALPPNRFPVPVLVVEEPKAGLLWPKRPPPDVFPPPNADVVLLEVFDPNPPNVEPLLPPNMLLPEEKGFDPKLVAVLLLVPNPPEEKKSQ